MYRIILTQLFILHTCIILPQLAPGKYWIQFTDKNNNSYSIDKPEEFLSGRAIVRRMNQNIPVTEQDLPVSNVYIDSLKALGLTILNTSKWFNGAVIESSDTFI